MSAVDFFIYLSVALIGGGFLLSRYVDYRLSVRAATDVYDDAGKIWTARGIYGSTVEENSIDSIREAFDQGAMGVEVDVFYDPEMDDYIVSHDRPYRLVQGELLTLEALFDALGAGHYFWLDFKKLRQLSRAQALQAVARLKTIAAKDSLWQRVYVEGETPVNLALFRRAGFHTIFDTHPTRDNNLFTGAVMAMYKMFYYFGEHSVMGMEYGALDQPIYGSKTQRRLRHVPVFLYHVPTDENLLKALVEIPTVKALIVGNNQSVNFHHIKSTQEIRGHNTD